MDVTINTGIENVILRQQYKAFLYHVASWYNMNLEQKHKNLGGKEILRL